jgi:hypothetical protein
MYQGVSILLPRTRACGGSRCAARKTSVASALSLTLSFLVEFNCHLSMTAMIRRRLKPPYPTCVVVLPCSHDGHDHNIFYIDLTIVNFQNEHEPLCLSHVQIKKLNLLYMFPSPHWTFQTRSIHRLFNNHLPQKQQVV